MILKRMVKFLVLGGIVFFFWVGKCQFYCYVREDFFWKIERKKDAQKVVSLCLNLLWWDSRAEGIRDLFSKRCRLHLLPRPSTSTEEETKTEIIGPIGERQAQNRKKIGREKSAENRKNICRRKVARKLEEDWQREVGRKPRLSCRWPRLLRY